MAPSKKKMLVCSGRGRIPDLYWLCHQRERGSSEIILGVDPHYLDSTFLDYGVTHGSENVPDILEYLEKTLTESNFQNTTFHCGDVDVSMHSTTDSFPLFVVLVLVFWFCFFGCCGFALFVLLGFCLFCFWLISSVDHAHGITVAISSPCSHVSFHLGVSFFCIN